MATAEQIKSLIQSHLSMNAEQFYASTLQILAHEARQGHTGLANEIQVCRNYFNLSSCFRG